MSLYPLALRLAGRRVLVVGGGMVATRRVPALIAAGAQVEIVTPELTPALRSHVDAGRAVWTPRRFTPGDVEGAWLVHVAIDDPIAAAEVSEAAEAHHIFCVRADDRDAATAWTPAVTRHGQVTVAVTDGGDRRRAMAVRDLVAHALEATPPAAPELKGVALVGGGPGDPELITVKGRRLLAAADVVVADRLVPGVLLGELRPEVELIDAAKIPYGPSAAQEEINRILVDRAQQGKFVVRLKGGDNFVFGRGGEEALACAAAGVPVVVVPGVTSSIAAPALAGIPVTHRGVAHEFTVVSGHIPPEHPDSLVDWPALARLRGTLVVLMGLKNLPKISERLIAEGRSPETPVAVVQEGSTAHQRSLRSTLGAVTADTAEAGIRPPAVVVIGDVVAVSDVFTPAAG
ncbi:uroporphyrin-III C-methyltransferase/precorrin-2 dehydrogenase/sirohydrochlorin ferrochelatase [Actinoplanes lutulentus]|uniref:Uroporphyrinogen-III C-methyltransferase n=1 Tax=Actinoplanes lutulentus TaxID=1287878 RepID=A0A327ZGU5_9ACTN|nr:uroporphyrinogen-III C-methyltransferase [Actinoplanes lutulentus]MBB2948095.1 uroporphyrin-III C-methyltransferase/precorrin-2 dehydrogenase/sirohydrochlorin ferrochelatase [Actinoplanes lutulentus]RAK40024.1 uroporphyrinogen-III C-methyltransferase [Actinoplanes lutulentus]